MAQNKFQSVDAYEADVRAILEKAEKNLSKEEYADLLENVSNNCDGKWNEVVTELRQEEINEIEL